MSKQFIEFGIDFSKYSTPSLVASLLGFSNIQSKSALGFRLHWQSLHEKGVFADCVCVGDFYNAYVGHHITGEAR